MSHQCKITVVHNGETVQVYPQKRETGYNLDEICKRIGMMVMSNGITDITVYRDGEVYRQCTVKNEVGA